MAERTGALTPWGSHWLGARIADLGSGPDDSLVYRGAGSQWSRHASTCEALADILRRGMVSFRGKHLRELLQLGVIGIAPMAAKVKGDTPEERLPKDGLLGKATLTTPSGTAYEVDIYVNDGVPFLADFSVLGEITATPLERIKIERRPNKQGFRWYGVYRVPSTDDTLRIRLDRLPTDVSNREENLRPFPPGDPDYKRLYGRRPDTESINSLLVRCSGQWRRAHSYGWRRQFLDLVGFALLINAGVAASFERRVAAGRPPDAARP